MGQLQDVEEESTISVDDTAGDLAPRRVGRPRKTRNTTRDLLLDAAETVFGERGYDSTAMLEVSARAGVNQALIRYYFGSKQGLFTAIYLRRGRQLSKARLDLLSKLEARKRKPPTVEEIVRAFLHPAMELRRSGGGLAYMRLQARLTNEVSEYALKLRREVHDEAAGRYIQAFQRARPDLDPKAIYWRMIFLLGCYFYGMADSNRLGILSSGNVDGADVEELHRQMVSFMTGGLNAPILDK